MASAPADSWKALAGRMKNGPGKAGPAVQQMIARMNEIWPFDTAKGVFDNGCGSGSIISYILDSFGDKFPETIDIIAGDFSQSMLDILLAQKQARLDNDQAVWDRLQILKLDAHKLEDLNNNSMSHVTGGHVYFLLDDPRQALIATSRVLCPGGLIGLTSGKSSQHIDALCDAVEKIKPGTDLKLLNEPWSTEEGVRGELSACGFEDPETFLVESTITYTNPKDFAQTLLSMPVMQETLSSFSEESKDRLQMQLIENLKVMDAGGNRRLSGVNIVAVGRKASQRT